MKRSALAAPEGRGTGGETRYATDGARDAADRALGASLRRVLLPGFLAGALAGGLFGFQAVLSEGWGTGLWFVVGIGLPAGCIGALIAAPFGALRGLARRRKLLRLAERPRRADSHRET